MPYIIIQITYFNKKNSQSSPLLSAYGVDSWDDIVFLCWALRTNSNLAFEDISELRRLGVLCR